MEQKKSLRINCALCDISNVGESTLAAYDSVFIKAALVLTSAKTQELMHKYHVILNAATVLAKPDNAEFKVVNGKYEIMAGEAPNQPVALLVNGSLEVGKDTEEVLRHYSLIQVNGSVTYPDSLSGKLDMLRVNGSTNCYPADAARLDNSFLVDKTFRLRAKAGRYHAKRRVVILNSDADVAALQNKGVRFLTKTAVLAESLAEAAIPMFDESTEIHIVPDGCAYVGGDTALNEVLVKRYGTKLYIAGDLVLDMESEPLISQLQYLKVLGSVQLPDKLVNAFCTVSAEYEALTPVKGLVLRDKVSFQLDKGLMERHPEGITLLDCVNVKLDKDIHPVWIEERLMIKDCVNVSCDPEQRSAVVLIGPNIVEVSLLNDILSDEQATDPDTQVINAAEFRLV
jgi:hypothetical protein